MGTSGAPPPPADATTTTTTTADSDAVSDEVVRDQVLREVTREYLVMVVGMVPEAPGGKGAGNREEGGLGFS